MKNKFVCETDLNERLDCFMNALHKEYSRTYFQNMIKQGRLTINGKKVIKSITIDPEVVDPDDVEMLEDLILTAVNEAVRQADEMSARELGKVTGGLGGGFGL